MDREEMLALAGKLRSLTAAAYALLSSPDQPYALTKPGAALVFLTVHHHGDLMLHSPAGYRNTSASDVAQLTGLHESTVARHLAELARRGQLVRVELGPRRVGYRPRAWAESWVTLHSR